MNETPNPSIRLPFDASERKIAIVLAVIGGVMTAIALLHVFGSSL